MLISVIYPSDIDGLIDKDIVTSSMLIALNKFKHVSDDKLSDELEGFNITYPAIMTLPATVDEEYLNRFIYIPKHGKDTFINILMTTENAGVIATSGLRSTFKKNATLATQFISEHNEIALPTIDESYVTSIKDVALTVEYVSHQVAMKNASALQEKVTQWMEWVDLHALAAPVLH